MEKREDSLADQVTGQQDEDQDDNDSTATMEESGEGGGEQPQMIDEEAER